MRDELLGYYERELSFLRQLGAEFAQKYPKVAGRLLLEADRCEDPHVERMIEAAAFLASRVHLKIDDEFPELTESLLGVLYPNFLAPVPSLSVVQFQMDAENANLRMGHTIERGAVVRSEPVDGSPCRFRTCYPVTVWPLEVAEARFELLPPGASAPAGARTVLRIQLRTLGGATFGSLRQKVEEGEPRPIDRVRFYLQGEGKVVFALYELLVNDLLRAEVRAAGGSGAAPIVLPEPALRPVGFDRDEALLPSAERSFPGYRLLQEYFAFPEKFLFLDVLGLDRAVGAGLPQGVDLLFYLGREFPAEKSVNAQTFRLHCTPIVNLYTQVAEPIRVTHLQSEYRVIPDVGRPTATEVYSIDDVSSIRPEEEKPIQYEPFYSIEHGAVGEPDRTFWHASRRPSTRRDDEGTEVYLTLVDLGFRPSVPDVETLTVRTTCSNRDLPSRLPFGASGGADFELEGAGVFTAIRCLRKPTASLRAPLRRGAQWRLISHLSLNYLSLVQESGDGGPQALQEILKLYDFADSAATRQQIAGLTKVSARRVLRPVGSAAAGFVRGVEVSVELDEAQFIGSGVFLFASVLERFLALYASINSFSQLIASTRQREGVLKSWTPRAGEQIVL
jgi:type VI secretion system protein ImpG